MRVDMRVMVPGDVWAYVKTLPIPVQRRIRVVIDGLPGNWWIGKRLEGEYAGCRVIRVWPYRIIYEVRKRECIIVVLRVADRKDAYR